MAVTGTILPKRYAKVINRQEQKKKILSHTTSVGNKRKQTEDRKTFFLSNIVSIVSSPSKKIDQNEVNAIQDLLQCSRSPVFLTRMNLHQCLYLHLLFPTLNHCLNSPYHHLIVDHVIETDLTGISNNKLNRK